MTLPTQTNNQSTSEQAVVLAPQSAELNPFAFPRNTDSTVLRSNILVVDDEPSTVKLLVQLLRRAGFENSTGETDSEKAMHAIGRQKFDLVLLDLRMSGVDGLQILQAIRRADRTKSIPVLVVSAIRDEQTVVTALNHGATDVLTKPVRGSELIARCRNLLSEKAYRDLVAARSLQLESDAMSDPLTGIANRRSFDFEIARRVMEWHRRKTPFALAMLDLDHFKQTNDQYGHTFGDQVLSGVAHVLQRVTRSMDLVARHGGEEFALLMPATSTTECIEVANRVRAAVQELSFDADGQKFSTTVSVGLAASMNGDDARLMTRRADIALYAAKTNGRNQVFFHDGGQCRSVSETTQPAASVRNLLPGDAEETICKSKILLIDDEKTTTLMIRKHLMTNGFQEFVLVNEPERALAEIEREAPNLIMLDVHMPGIGGLEILKQLRGMRGFENTPAIVVTSSKDREVKLTALELGATDFLHKPVDPSELTARVRNSLMAKMHVDALADYSQRLEFEVKLRTTELAASRREAIQCLARAAELRDDETGQHVLRVGRYAAIIAEEMGFRGDRLDFIELAAQLHDVGKIGIPDSILKKPGLLSDDEYEEMKTHCVQGTHIIRDNNSEDDLVQPHTTLGKDLFDACNSPIMRMAAIVAQTHHEKWDGSGYPNELKGEDIPIEGRITAVADVFDALSTKRHYKDAIELEECFQMIADGSGSHFDPQVVKTMFAKRSDIVRTLHEYSD